MTDFSACLLSVSTWTVTVANSLTPIISLRSMSVDISRHLSTKPGADYSVYIESVSELRGDVP